MRAHVEVAGAECAPKKNKQQLILFVNLKGVNPAKKDLFVKFAQARASCLNASYSAFNISLDENSQLQAADLANEQMRTFIAPPNAGNNLKTQQVFDAKLLVMDQFQAKLKPIGGSYEYILVVGEMVRSISGNSISNITHLSQLADYLKEMISRFAAKHLHLRIQVCFSKQVCLPRTTSPFAEALIPEGKFVHLSAPTGWSMIGRNGTAIDFNLVHDVHFVIWAPFLSYVITNNLDLEKIKNLFYATEWLASKKECSRLAQLMRDRPQTAIEDLYIRLHYPSQTSEDKVFICLEHQSKNSFMSIAATGPSPSHSPNLFRDRHTHSPMPRAGGGLTPTEDGTKKSFID